MDERPWLPGELAGTPFSTATAVELGVPVWRLRAPHLYRPTRSVRAAEQPRELRDRARAFATALPDDVAFSHATAALLWGLALPDRYATDLLHVMRRSDRTRVRRTGCRGHRGLEVRSTATLSGLRVTSLADTWADLGELVAAGLGHDELVIVGDEVATRLLGPPEPGAGRPDWRRAVGEMEAVVAGRTRPRGKRVLVRALSALRAPVRSPMETRSRLMFVRAGFPEPLVNEPVHGRDGQWILEGDLVWPEQRVVGEYQGADHGSIRRRSSDAARASVAADEDWTVLEIYADDVRPGPRNRACLRRFAGALGLCPEDLRIS